MLLCDYKKGEQEFNFKMPNSIITDYYYRRAIERLVTGMNEFQARGWRWTLARVKILEVHINKYNPLRGSS